MIILNGSLPFAVVGVPISAYFTAHDTVLLTEAVRCRLERPEAVRLEERGEIEIRGKSHPVALYAAVARHKY